MNTEEFFKWLDKEQLSSFIKNTTPFKKILSNHFDPYKKIIIMSDFGYPTARIAPIMAALYTQAAKELNLDYKLILQQPKVFGEDADDKIIEAFLQSNGDTLLLMAFSDRIGSLRSIGKSFRKYAKSKNLSFLSTQGLSQLKTAQFDRFMKSIDIDYEELRKRGDIIKQALDNGKTARIYTEAGTDLTLDISEYKSIPNDGFYKGGKGGNLPVGEIYIAPGKRKVNGTLVIDVSSKNREGTLLINEEPITVTIKDGEIIKLEGGPEADTLNASFEWAIGRAKHPWGIKLVGELGIGINPNAEIIGPTIVNEKKAGTAHIAFGSNSWFGGNIFSITHFDQVFNNPKIEIDGQPLDLKRILDYSKPYV
ncbi:aminopeptidase [Candidatus Woesearchaeota archaeon]|nr:aminopeptidase [Candidatus Woesearchaeota archaeon]